MYNGRLIFRCGRRILLARRSPHGPGHRGPRVHGRRPHKRRPHKRRPHGPDALSSSTKAAIALLVALCFTGCHAFHAAAPRTAGHGAARKQDTHALFADVAAAAGVRFHHNNGATGRFNTIEVTGSGCAFFDYDNDGYLDILMVQSGPFPRHGRAGPDTWCHLYHNNRNGTFTDVTPGSGLDRDLGYCQGAAIGDYNNDGFDDIFLTGYGGNHLLQNQKGSGKFKDVTDKAGLTDREQGSQYATSAAFGDYDNDGYLDLFVCHYTRWRPETNPTCRDARGDRDYCSPDVLAPVTSRLYHNNRDGTFSDVTRKSGMGKLTGRSLAAAWLDYDGDGRQDLYVVNDLNPAFLWHNDGGGRFTERAVDAGCAYDNRGNPMAGMGIGLADYDHSGWESIFVSNFSGQPNTLFRNTGGGHFEDVSIPAGVALPHMRYLSFGCSFLDYDADGWPDLIVGNGHVEEHAAETFPGTTVAEPKQLFHNTGRGTFEEVKDHLGDLANPVISRGLATGDYDNDGRVDVLVNNQNGDAQLFHNQDHSQSHWISFKTIGARSNRDGYGARITASTGPTRYFSEVHGSSSYASHSDSRVYFGLGARTAVTRVEIRWPSGTRETFKNLPADRFYVLTEGKGITRTSLPTR